MANEVIRQVPWENKPVPDKGAALRTVPWEKKDTTPAKAGDTIFRQGDVFTGDKNDYVPGGPNIPANKQKYEQQGEPFTIFGIPIGDFRTQKTSVEGKEGTQFVPKAAQDVKDVIRRDTASDTTPLVKKLVTAPLSVADDALDFLGGGDEAASDRILQSIGLETIKGTVNLGLWLADNAVDTATFNAVPKKDASGNVLPPEPNIIDKVYEDFNKHFPTMPVGSNVEKLVSEIGTFIVGLAGGRKLITEGPKLPLEVTKFLASIYGKIARQKDPVAAAKALDLLLKSMIKETSGNLGGTAISPDNIQSYAQDFGLTDDNKTGLFIDNMAFSTALGTIGQIAGITARTIGNILKTKKMDKAAAAKSIMSLVDEGINDATTPEELDRRVTIMADILNKNKEFKFQILDKNYTVQGDTTSAMLNGAVEYFTRVYEDVYQGMPPNMFQAEVQTKAEMMVRNMADLKKAYYNKPHVSAKDSDMIKGFGDAMTSTADTITGDAANASQIRGQAAVDLGTPIANALNTPEPSKLSVLTAEQVAESEKKKNRIIEALLQARRDLNPSSAQYDEDLTKVGLDLYNNRQAAYDAVKAEFAKVSDVPVNAVELAQAIKAAGDEPGILETMGIAPSEGKFVRPIADDSIDQQTGALISPVNDLAKKLEGLTLKDLVTRVRPLLALAKDRVKRDKVNTDTTQYDMMINWIDETAKNAGPEFAKAMDTYKLYTEKFENTEMLRSFGEVADTVRKQSLSTGEELTPKNYPSMIEAGRRALEDSMNALTRDQLKLYLEAAKTPENGKAVTQALVGRAINQLALKQGDISSNELISALEPILKTLEVAGDTDTIKTWTDAVEQLRMIEAGLLDSKNAYETLVTSSRRIMETARESAAYAFVTKAGGGAYKPVDIGEANEAFKAFFSSPNLPSRMDQILKQAKQEGNELAINGIKSQFLKWIKERVSTQGNPTGVTMNGNEATFNTDFSMRQLNNILNAENGDTTLASMEKLFADDKKSATAFIELLKVTGGFVNLRGMRAQAFGSQTAGATQLQKAVNTMITIGFGVLNPTATKMRTISRLFTEDADASSKYVAEKLIDGMIADPMLFKEALEKLANDVTGRTATGVVRSLLTGAANPLARGTYTATHGTVDEQTQEAVPTN